MKAAVFKKVGQPLSLEALPEPRAGAGEVVIKVGRCGICRSDLHMTSGHGATFPEGSVLGHEFAGEIVEVGEGVASLRLGDRITAMPLVGCGSCAECLQGFPFGCTALRSMSGGYGEYLRAAARCAVKLPSTLSLEDGALIEPLASALRGVAMSGLRPGSRVAVLGAGTIGLGAIYWARQLGAEQILVIARSERQKDMAMQFGATHFLTQGEALAARAAAALGALPEVVLECIGAPGALGLATEVVASRGTVVALGMCLVPDTVTPFVAGFKSMVLKFSAAYELKDFEAAARALDRGAVEPRAMVSERISLEQLPSTFEQLRTESRGCKIMVTPHG
jgi:threonine dehydrogenase-like Zn-dependent dehydrogenase